MTNRKTLSRRSFLNQSAAGIGALALGGTAQQAFAATPLTVGFIYVGPRDDFGYNQAHAEGAAAVAAMEGVTVIEEENVPETQDVQNTMQSMIQFDGATLLFPTSFGYFNPHILEVAPNYPDLRFQHCGGLWNSAEHPSNVGSYFGYIGMGQYLNGIAAGHATQSKKIGFVAAKPIPQVLNNINSFLLGARAVDPEIVCQVIFTGEWSLAVKEAEATNALADQGCDVITCHVDGPKVVVETAAGRGAYVCGYHADQSALAPDLYLTGAEWNWAGVYQNMIETVQAGGSIDNFVRGGLADGFIKMSPLGPAVSDAARNQFEAVKAEIMQGGFAAIKGPLNDNEGNVIATASQSFPEDDVALESMDYLVEGVIGSTGA
ncbi:BMP family ABC transporter substrate-binding protein [Ponticoccus sp. SC2-23]|uniref:BMP family ABC transporter substrate-binding protein n=1 Tax=Alexandriicola marinus TaxID=2081710 RepID=UPI000FD93170|nr:BMP family ABC transporter substrate-binding protein [Alexandriicola marinus]MBM1221604.1 BMP family ABC transporter substrate-binding protein [Ponticoccus sp. SC6-9]MBM1226645.1 BMP family ABC transporter substrate-binding protein [Ponticoccus sp. SC6-15]MBM1230596.1 BMP family ABC transporter substrate-binding protein [Ponticoccus sp. SC6-38]MBM1235119.1 BMP family ABC transporter substrate-binding protein [Ponticoccus sp. SC6-45]MBM1239617.1 BMP family ABC transporter substrate-binding p